MPRLTEQEQQEIIRFLEADRPLPDKYRFLLFGDKREVELVWNGKTNEVCNIVVANEEGRMVPFSEVCGGRALKADGYYPVKDVIRAYLRTSWDTFQSEMLCKRPVTRGVIYPQIIDPVGGGWSQMLTTNYDDLWLDSDKLIAGVDAGFNCATGVWLVVRVNGDIIVIDRLRCEQVQNDQFARAFYDHHFKRGYRPLFAMGSDKASPGLKTAFNEPAISNTLFQLGAFCAGAENKHEYGYNLIRTLLTPMLGKDGKPHCKLYFTPRSRQTFEEMAALRAKKDATGGFVNDQLQSDLHDADAARYALTRWRELTQSVGQFSIDVF